MRRGQRNVLQITLSSAVILLLIVAVGYLAAGGESRFHPQPVGLRFANAGVNFGDSSAVLSADRADGSTAPTTAGLHSALEEILLDPNFAAFGISVVDLESQKVLLEQNATDLLIPASATKVATAMAVLAERGAEYRIPTKVVAGSSPGEVILVGGGDPTLTAGAEGAYRGAARLDDLAQQVREHLGQQPITRVLIDTSAFQGDRTGPAWPDGSTQSEYVAPITSLMIDGGRRNPGDDARVSSPDVAAGETFAQLLGVSEVQSGFASSDAKSLGTVYSPPIRTLVDFMLTDSDNVIAETLARQVAFARGMSPTFEGGAAATSAALASKGLSSGTSLEDGSGLSRSNRLTAHALTALLQTASTDLLYRPMLSALSVAGYDGTLMDRFDEVDSAAGRGVVRGKTGTLSQVSALTGVVLSKEGHQLAFAVVANDFPAGDAEEVRQGLDRFAAILATCGCR